MLITQILKTRNLSVTRPYLLILSKLFHQMKTKYANINAYRSNSHSNYHTKNDELLILFVSVCKQLYAPKLIIVLLQIETLAKSLTCQASQRRLRHHLPNASQTISEQFDLECLTVPQFPVCKIIVTRSISENIQCYVIIWIYLCTIHLEIEAAHNPNMVVLKIGIFKRSLVHKVSIPIDGTCALIKGAQGSTEVLSAICIRWLFPEDAIDKICSY